ncbi:MAG TPA: hypothetical protein VFE33_05185 [Thermoanaerobaculia bacterium]|nr:hypothetical protein [Thermoanaerobaculia bacterium]
MKKKMRRIQLSRETIRQLDPPILGWAAGGALGTASCSVFICPITAPRLTEECGTGGTGPKQQ